MTEMTHERRGEFAAGLAAAPRRGLTLCFVFALLTALSCLFSWANLDVFVFHRSYVGLHFGEGRLAFAFALAALILAAAAFAKPRLAYSLPLFASTTLGLVAAKYHDVSSASSSFRGFRLSIVSVGDGLVLALVASALLVCASLLGRLDHLGVAGSQRAAPASLEDSP